MEHHVVLFLMAAEDTKHLYQDKERTGDNNILGENTIYEIMLLETTRNSGRQRDIMRDHNLWNYVM